MEYTCGNCNNDIIDIGSGVCPNCGTEFELPGNLIPWEERDTIGIYAAFTATLMLSISKPANFFHRVPVTGGFVNPMLYALICGLLGTLFNLAWQLIFTSIGTIEMDPDSADESTGFYILFALLSPLLIPIGLFIGTGILQLSLKVLRVGNLDFESTFRVISYSSGATLFAIVPIVGSLIGAILSIVLESFGLRDVYKITAGKAFIAIMLPLLFALFLLIISAGI